MMKVIYKLKSKLLHKSSVTELSGGGGGEKKRKNISEIEKGKFNKN